MSNFSLRIGRLSESHHQERSKSSGRASSHDLRIFLQICCIGRDWLSSKSLLKIKINRYLACLIRFVVHRIRKQKGSILQAACGTIFIVYQLRIQKTLNQITKNAIMAQWPKYQKLSLLVVVVFSFTPGAVPFFNLIFVSDQSLKFNEAFNDVYFVYYIKYWCPSLLHFQFQYRFCSVHPICNNQCIRNNNERTMMMMTIQTFCNTKSNLSVSVCVQNNEIRNPKVSKISATHFHFNFINCLSPFSSSVFPSKH